MNYKTVQLNFDSGTATLTLNRPDKRNAISYELIDDLIRALEEVQNSTASVLILTGAGKAFCSGMERRLGCAIRLARLPWTAQRDTRTQR